ncbi:DUF3105 domain-containing protein [Streptomyces sp. NPDC091292]|uniref:DUF3105 domain-containing protein n=1 Tax=Streptomyces sp. NPDC091292 TaxID=3365991 RepID=UPI00382DAD20
MGSAKNTPTPSRKARIEEMRRAERSRDRRNRGLVITGSVIVVAALVAGGAYLFSQNSGDDDKASTQADSKSAGTATVDKDGVSSWDAKKLGRTHVTKTVTYPMTPPVGGDHNQAWMNCNGDVYEKAIPDMNAVHSLEHGAVWVTYNDKAPEADVQKLAEKVKKTPYTLMSPVQGQKDPIMLTAWGKQRTVTAADDPNVDAFFSAYVQGSQTPEPGAACTNGLSQ